MVGSVVKNKIKLVLILVRIAIVFLCVVCISGMLLYSIDHSDLLSNFIKEDVLRNSGEALSVLIASLLLLSFLVILIVEIEKNIKPTVDKLKFSKLVAKGEMTVYYAGQYFLHLDSDSVRAVCTELLEQKTAIDERGEVDNFHVLGAIKIPGSNGGKLYTFIPFVLRLCSNIHMTLFKKLSGNAISIANDFFDYVISSGGVIRANMYKSLIEYNNIFFDDNGQASVCFISSNKCYSKFSSDQDIDIMMDIDAIEKNTNKELEYLLKFFNDNKALVESCNHTQIQVKFIDIVVKQETDGMFHFYIDKLADDVMNALRVVYNVESDSEVSISDDSNNVKFSDVKLLFSSLLANLNRSNNAENVPTVNVTTKC